MYKRLLELIDPSSNNKINLVRFPFVVTLDQYEMILNKSLGRTVGTDRAIRYK